MKKFLKVTLFGLVGVRVVYITRLAIQICRQQKYQFKQSTADKWQRLQIGITQITITAMI